MKQELLEQYGTLELFDPIPLMDRTTIKWWFTNHLETSWQTAEVQHISNNISNIIHRVSITLNYERKISQLKVFF